MSHIESVQVYRRLIESLLAKAEELKPDKQIEPPLTEADFGDSTWRIEGSDANVLKRENQQANYAAVETAFRERFYDLLATTSIDDPSFVQIWHLLDVVSIFSDNEQCEPGLIFWLIEELLDSQTIDGCRKVFDYLESRRERNTTKHFKQKSLIILRSCNELLRRLSRAEDTVFCGRVFIYLFQSFPLGDKSSVNLRGEYHTENVTTFDEVAREAQKEEKPEEQSPALKEDGPTDTVDANTAPTGHDSPASRDAKAKVPGAKLEKDAGKEPVDLDMLYPIFWGLQAFFSAPTRLFDPENFASFKNGLEATLSAFKRTNTDIDPRSGGKGSDEAKRGTKRKRTTDGSEVTSSFNPKYLTSRDLFDLEISDIAFRRHVLVQALIILDFLLSLTPKAKAKLADLTNKSVLYNFVLNDDDARWATNIRHGIEGYLQEGVGGKFYYRMVDNVLSRDKNWIRWKAEGCPLIERPAVSVKDYLDARETAAKTYANKRLRPSPMGSLDLKFLSDAESLGSLERLKEPDRFSKPAPDSLMMGIVDDDFDLDMAQTKEDKDDAMRSKASKTWRTLRLCAKSKMNQFDKIEDGRNIKVLFETPSQPEESAKPTVESTNNTGKADTEPKGDEKENNTTVDQPMADAKAEDIEKTTEAPA
ncbi:THO complex subunit Tho1 [Paecilomyces variotii No. 5]|uniref:THO complex subunit Tho1 n=1 Tax=Byssochlamys spectabilis (strain No. 5 / NBRC 109023) TaxID=1356009 RepID=V5FSC3_BYSSN|nr:THO complex subunit Tho1 [Paecilomyces variotii No. 5]